MRLIRLHFDATAVAQASRCIDRKRGETTLDLQPELAALRLTKREFVAVAAPEGFVIVIRSESASR